MPKENWFKNPAEARKMTRALLHDYNHHRPHTALRGLPPLEFACRWAELRSTPVPSAQRHHPHQPKFHTKTKLIMGGTSPWLFRRDKHESPTVNYSCPTIRL